jgi:hypothetical protein
VNVVGAFRAVVVGTFLVSVGCWCVSVSCQGSGMEFL